MRSLRFLGLVFGLLAVTAVASPWVTWGVNALVGKEFTFGRVYNRVFEVLLIVALPLAWRRLDLGSAAAIGFRRVGWARDLGRGLAIGLAGIASALVLCGLLGALKPSLRYEPLKTARKAALGLGAAVVVGAGEEALFRGVLLRRSIADFGMAGGLAITTGLYAAVHAIGKGGKEPVVDVWSGVRRTRALFAPVVDPAHRRELVGLVLFGSLLAAARLRTGSLWLPIGLHAAWVAMFRVGRLFVVIRETPVWLVGPGWPPLVGGAAGWLAVAVSALLLLLAAGRRVRS